jgi:ATP-dependent Lon protease
MTSRATSNSLAHLLEKYSSPSCPKEREVLAWLAKNERVAISQEERLKLASWAALARHENVLFSHALKGLNAKNFWSVATAAIIAAPDAFTHDNSDPLGAAYWKRIALLRPKWKTEILSFGRDNFNVLDIILAGSIAKASSSSWHKLSNAFIVLALAAPAKLATMVHPVHPVLRRIDVWLYLWTAGGAMTGGRYLVLMQLLQAGANPNTKMQVSGGEMSIVSAALGRVNPKFKLAMPIKMGAYYYNNGAHNNEASNNEARPKAAWMSMEMGGEGDETTGLGEPRQDWRASVSLLKAYGASLKDAIFPEPWGSPGLALIAGAGTPCGWTISELNLGIPVLQKEGVSFEGVSESDNGIAEAIMAGPRGDGGRLTAINLSQFNEATWESRGGYEPIGRFMEKCAEPFLTQHQCFGGVLAGLAHGGDGTLNPDLCSGIEGAYVRWMKTVYDIDVMSVAAAVASSKNMSHGKTVNNKSDNNKEHESGSIKDGSIIEENNGQQWRLFTEESREKLLKWISTRRHLDFLQGWDKRFKGAEGLPRIAATRRLARAAHALEGMEALQASFPHFKDVIKGITDHLSLSCVGDGSFYLPPLLMAGPPGTGKTFFFQELSRLINTPCHILNMESIGCGEAIVGLESVWSNSSTGMIFDALIEGDAANPILLLDEIDKCSKDKGYNVDNVLLSLLENHSAANFRDRCVPLTLDARKIIWVATANDLSGISAPMLSRFEVVEVANPDYQARRAMAGHIYRSLRAHNSWGQFFEEELNEEIMEALTKPQGAARALRKNINSAFASAARAGRARLMPIDVVDKDKALIRAAWDERLPERRELIHGQILETSL